VKSRRQRVLSLVKAACGRVTDHAADEMDRLDLTWEDVVSVVATASRHHAARDEKKPSRLKDSFVGRDTSGRRMYIAGKEIRRDGTATWLVITFHESDKE
jgi:hypothetical protein